MFADTSTPPGRACSHCGAAATAAQHVCPQCAKLLPIAEPVDYFSFLGLPRKLVLDASDLERRYRALSRQFHPDYYGNAPAAERRASLERASYLNDAYRALKSLPSRIEYLLTLIGASSPGRRGDPHMPPRVPPTLLEDVFALNEELDAIRALRASGQSAAEWRARLEQARGPIEARRGEHEAELELLARQWDALEDAGVADDDDDRRARSIVTELGARMLERNYIINLLATLEREAAEPGTVDPEP